MDARFEEKTYEFLMNEELGDRKHVWAVGQNEEHVLGIDATMKSTNPRFWNTWGLPKPEGVHIDKSYWDGVSDELDGMDLSFKYNLFVQYKRPERIASHYGKEYGKWGMAYFRYDVDPDQNAILRRLEGRLGPQALVVYASAAFLTKKEMVEFRHNDTLIENSNFTKAGTLGGHERYTYAEGGGYGIPCSESPDSRAFDFLETIDSYLRESLWDGRNSEFIADTGNMLRETMSQAPADYAKAYDLLLRHWQVPAHPFYDGLVCSISFSLLLGITWAIGYASNREREKLVEITQEDIARSVVLAAKDRFIRGTE